MCFLLLFYFGMAAVRKFRAGLIVITSIVCLVYILWRATVIPFHNGPWPMVLGILLYFAEILGLLSFFNFQYLFLKKYCLKKKTLTEFHNRELPFVDVLICTYNEPLPLLEMTIAAAASMDYPEDRYLVHICDDKRREDLRVLCRQYGISYITRENNEGAKAGNINHAMTRIHGELMAVLDADMIPSRDFLTKTVGYFSDPNLAFVQTPQVYYNQDMYQYNLSRKIPNEQDFFMRDIQEARAARNAVLHVGTNAVFRRSTVLEIGGYPTCSITEDMAVGMQLQAHGYDSVFVNEELVYGLSATTFAELVKQRDRWCRGNLQVLKHFSPIFTRGLTISQKIAYLDGGIYWFSNLQKMVYILCPLFYLLIGTVIFDCRLEELFQFYFPFLLGQFLIFHILSPKTRSMKWAHYYEMVMAPHLSMSVIRELLNRKTSFNVTSKEVVLDRKSFQMRMVLPHIVIFFLTVIAWIAAVCRLRAGTADFGSVMLNIFWSGYNLMGIVIALRVAFQKPMLRKLERVSVHENIEVTVRYKKKYITARMADLSGRGTLLNLSGTYQIKKGQLVRIRIGKADIPAEVIRSDGSRLALQFHRITSENMKRIMEIFCRNMEAYYKVEKPQDYYVEQTVSEEKHPYFTVSSDIPQDFLPPAF